MPPPVKSENTLFNFIQVVTVGLHAPQVIMRTKVEFRKFPYAHQMRDADISRMRKRPCETIVQVTACIFFYAICADYAGRATVTLREDAKSREECKEEASRLDAGMHGLLAYLQCLTVTICLLQCSDGLPLAIASLHHDVGELK
jgi:hypothetical protein